MEIHQAYAEPSEHLFKKNRILVGTVIIVALNLPYSCSPHLNFVVSLKPAVHNHTENLLPRKPPKGTEGSWHTAVMDTQ